MNLPQVMPGERGWQGPATARGVKCRLKQRLQRKANPLPQSMPVCPGGKIPPCPQRSSRLTLRRGARPPQGYWLGRATTPSLGCSRGGTLALARPFSRPSPMHVSGQFHRVASAGSLEGPRAPAGALCSPETFWKLRPSLPPVLCARHFKEDMDKLERVPRGETKRIRGLGGRDRRRRAGRAGVPESGDAEIEGGPDTSLQVPEVWQYRGGRRWAFLMTGSLGLRSSRVTHRPGPQPAPSHAEDGGNTP